MVEGVVLDASVVVELLTGSSHAPAVRARLAGHHLHAPAHLDAEVLSALGRLQRGGRLSTRAVTAALRRHATLPVERHLLAALLDGAWARRSNLRLADALYVELADTLGAPLLTTDAALAAASHHAELIEP
jgi:predicted nucleic acid-binding protein